MNHVRLNNDELTDAVLNGAPVYGPADEKVGSVSEVQLYGAGHKTRVIVDVGGFLGIGAKPIEFTARDLSRHSPSGLPLDFKIA